jgi:hypothetical protein
VRLLHSLAKIHASFDDPNLVSRAGLVPVMALAQRAGLPVLAGEHVRIARRCGVNAQVKVGCLVAGMIGGADSTGDLDMLRHGAMGALFGGIRAPSTLGSFLRSFTWGNVLQLQKVSRLVLAELARRAPLLPGKDVLAFVDTGLAAKTRLRAQEAGGGVRPHQDPGQEPAGAGPERAGSHPQHPAGRAGDRRHPAARRQRGSARGAASFATEAVHTARGTGCTGIVLVRADSAFYSAAFTGAVRAAGARFSVTVQMNPHVRAAIASIPDTAWTPIQYPRALWDGQLACWVSDAEVAETEYTAFTSKKGQAITARLIVRRVKDLNRQAAQGQDELFPVWRYHAIFTDSPFVTLQAEEQHRDHAQVEQVLADWTDGPSLTCPQARSPPTPPGPLWQPSATTCCAPPGRWPASPTPRPAAPRCAVTSSTSPPAPPATAAKSPCTCPKAGIANKSG